MAENEETSLPVSLEKEILDILSRPDEDHEETINVLCDRHPEFADTIRRRLQAAAAFADDIIHTTRPSPVDKALDASGQSGGRNGRFGRFVRAVEREDESTHRESGQTEQERGGQVGCDVEIHRFPER